MFDKHGQRIAREDKRIPQPILAMLYGPRRTFPAASPDAPAPIFPVGARVYVDGRDEATVAQAFPKGSSSFLFAHYKVHFTGGDRNVAVSMKRVGVVKAVPCEPCKGSGAIGWTVSADGPAPAACGACKGAGRVMPRS